MKHSNKLTALIAVLILVFVAFFAANAQEKQNKSVEVQVAQIRQISAATNKRIDAGLKDRNVGFHFATWTIGGVRDTQPWAAVGTMEQRTEVWFDGEPDPEAEANSPDADPAKLVRKITTSYKGAADLHSRTESMFDDSGDLVFVFSSSDIESENRKMIERRFYFAKGKLIRIARDGKNTDVKFSEDDAKTARDEMKMANELQNDFATIFGK
ncbi:MAG: hypothetical protein WKF34_02960 [Pyrinomonadaceae bacterium]